MKELTFSSTYNKEKKELRRKIKLVNEAGIIREVKVGFSWTILCFGPIPFLFRGMPLHFMAYAIFLAGGDLVAGVVYRDVTFLMLLLVIVFLVISAFIGNKQTAHHYLEHGYRIVGEERSLAASEWNLEIKKGDVVDNDSQVPGSDAHDA